MNDSVSLDNLPVGSIVLLKGSSHRLFVAGFAPVLKNKNNKMYDYIGLPYPEGFIGFNSLIVFNKKRIEKVVMIGYSDEEDKKFKKELQKTIEKVKNNEDLDYIMEEAFNKFNGDGVSKNEQQ